MRRTRFDDWPCPIARTTDLIGDWWTPLVMREAFLGARRFDDFQRRLDLSRAVLSARLTRLTDEGLLARIKYQDAPPRFEYRLTDKGRAFWDVLAAMWQWGDDWLWEDEPDDNPLVLLDRDSGEVVEPTMIDRRTGQPLDVRRLRVALARSAAQSGDGATGRSPAVVHPDQDPT